MLNLRQESDMADAGLRFDGMTIVVTGASSGLGVELARALDAGGAGLVLVGRREDRLRALAGELRDALPVGADLVDPSAGARIVEAATARFGRIDGLVNNAGITNVAPALREELDDFRRVLDVNVVAPFAMSQAVARTMRESGGGSIVNVASVVGLQAITLLPEAGYAASKAGLLGLTRELAVQWARYGIRVNAVAPGGFSSEMTGDVWEEQGRYGPYMAERVPLGRAGRPGELDGPVLSFLHPSTSYVTGQVVAVDGGMTAC
jgi:NAD(P)-dependent dehydrogenase (short-subunit alcohol dehydrogenase family)